MLPDLTPLQWTVAAVAAVSIGIAKTGVPGFGIFAVPLFALLVGDAVGSAGWLLPLLIVADLFAVAYHRRHAQVGRLVELIPWVLVGMVLGGIVNDILVRRAPGRTAAYAAAICLTSGVLLLAAFQLPTGWTQLGLIATGLFVGAAIPGPAGAMVANLTDPKVHGSAFATLTLANNFLGLAPGAYVTGLLADRLGGLLESLQLIPVTCLVAGSLFLAVTRRYGHDLERRP